MSIIVIDPGHGGAAPVGNDSECTKSSPNNASGPNGTREKDLTLDIALRVHAALQGSGHTVLLTRNTDVNLQLDERAAVAKQSKAAVFISIHFNGDLDPSVQGTETWVYENANITPSVKASPASVALAKVVQKNLVVATGYRDRGLKRKRLCVLKPAFHDPLTAACLAEISFITNAADETRLGGSAYKDTLAAAIAQAALEYIDRFGIDRLEKGSGEAPRESDGECPAFIESFERGLEHRSKAFSLEDSTSLTG